MAEAILYGIAVEILKNIGSTVVDEIASAGGFKSDLDKLKRTISTIKDYLLDAEEKQADGHAVRSWLLKLTDVVYAADNLFDEFATVVSRKQITGGNKFTKKVRTFFSHDNQIAYARSISRKIKTIREELDGLIKEGTDFHLVPRSYEEGRVIIRRRDQSHSFTKAEDVIGRDVDKNAILELLLSSSSNDDEHEQKVLPVVSIIGMGGMGKTALAQLIYNDPLVQEFFPLRLWVCVSDAFDIKEITEKILKSATNSETPKLEMDQLQGRLRTEIGDKKYLLVFDDVWNENREEWLKMRSLLKMGRKGSKIMVTTRLSKVAKIMSTVPPYDLQGLSEEKSWELFQKVAFAPEQAQQMPHLVDIGKEIVQKCANVPLAIRTLGSILYGENESQWLSMKHKSLAKIPDEENNIMNILKISYHHLGSPLKNCFAYCALFPKDYNFNKDRLIDLWMAEGFIVPVADESQTLEDLGEVYFFTLLQRGLFQDVKTDEWGHLKSCKMHDLIHDLSQEVAGVKCKVMKTDEDHLQNNIYHLSFGYRLNFQSSIPTTVLSSRMLRTLLLPQQFSDGSTFNNLMCQQILSSLCYLRVLDLHGLGLINLPTSIGKLIHLRYLDLSFNPISVLPDSITKLHQLQTLNLNHCTMLHTLPAKIKKLVNLTSLDIGNCYPFFRHMPLGIGELTSLHNLPIFIVTSQARSARLSDLKKLNNLRGKLHIVFKEHLKSTMSEAREGDLTGKHGLNELEINLPMGKLDLFGNLVEVVVPPEVHSDHDEVVLEGLKPHGNLKKLKVSHYKGRRLPNWAIMDNLIPTFAKLVEIELCEWNYIELPAFSQLPLLKRLSLTRLLCVEYIEMLNDDHSIFFPSLEILKLHVMNNLKGWWKGVGTSYEYELPQPSLSFPKLSELDISVCENLTSLPTCPNVERVHLVNTNKDLSILKIVTDSSKLKSLTIDSVEDLVSVPKQCLHQLSWLCIKDATLINTNKLGDFFATFAASLKYLSFQNCDNLRSISKGLEHLTALEMLNIHYCDQLDLSLNEQQLECEDKIDNGKIYIDMPWKAFKTSLRSLQLSCLKKLVSLPCSLRHLTNLRSLCLSFNYELRDLPEWISCFSFLEFLKLGECNKLTYLPESLRKLSSLHELQIIYCKKLIERCRGPDGSEWPKIQHIPLVVVKDLDSVV